MEITQVETNLKLQKKYLRQRDLAVRYNVSEQHITNLIKKGEFPPPMKRNNMNVWPVELLDRIDNDMNQKYFEKLGKKWKSSEL
jgi:predicted DNA-binding transcriptional regulator AlpA